ncbi:unnamed protein product [Musa textilis]
MGSRLGRRVIHFANLPIKLLLPSPPFDSIREIALKTIPSASKVEIRRVLESLYGFDVAEVRTLNMEGKKTKRGPFLAAKPDYKKAYVTLRSPLSLSPTSSPSSSSSKRRSASPLPPRLPPPAAPPLSRAKTAAASASTGSTRDAARSRVGITASVLLLVVAGFGGVAVAAAAVAAGEGRKDRRRASSPGAACVCQSRLRRLRSSLFSCLISVEDCVFFDQTCWVFRKLCSFLLV